MAKQAIEITSMGSGTSAPFLPVTKQVELQAEAFSWQCIDLERSAEVADHLCDELMMNPEEADADRLAIVAFMVHALSTIRKRGMA